MLTVSINLAPQRTKRTALSAARPVPTCQTYDATGQNGPILHHSLGCSALKNRELARASPSREGMRLCLTGKRISCGYKVSSEKRTFVLPSPVFIARQFTPRGCAQSRNATRNENRNGRMESRSRACPRLGERNAAAELPSNCTHPQRT